MRQPEAENFLAVAKEQLKHLESGSLDAELLLAHVIQKDRAYLRAYPEIFLTEAQKAVFEKLLALRAKKIPLAYLIGKKEFWSLAFKVTPDVLIPRPETELLVEKILADYAGQSALTLADIGTGSGAIAIALAHEKPNWKILASDVSELALEVAKENAAQLVAWVEARQSLAENPGGIIFIHSCYFDSFPEGFRADVIVSNPPYLSKEDPHLLNTEISHEPREALVAEGEGLEAFYVISDQAKRFLKPGGRLYFEHGCDQGPEVRKILAESGYDAIQTFSDLAGLPRVTCGLKGG